MARPMKDMTGQKIGKLYVVEKVGAWDRQIWWKCKCECGTEKVMSGATLRRGKVKSCGCVYRETRREIAHMSIAKEKHGDSFARLYFVWQDMKARCGNPNNISFKHYGGRGISVCDEWKSDYLAFKKWSLENGYDENAKHGECTIDRIDKDGNYCPENCRWAGMKVQSNNRRNTPEATIDGVTATVSEWADKTGLPRSLIYSRYKRGWTGRELISPQDQHRRRVCVSHSMQGCQPKNKQSTD